MAKLDRLFKISPMRVKAKDGSGDTVIVEHRIGKAAGAFTSADLMNKLGLEDEYFEIVKDLEKKFRDRKKFQNIADKIYSGQKEKLGRIVSRYRQHLDEFYGSHPRPLMPMFAFVPISEKEDALYLQGLLDEQTLKLLIGDPEDDALWSETIFLKTKTFADLNARAKKVARALMSHPNINKDLVYRMEFISKGQVPDKLVWDKKE